MMREIAFANICIIILFAYWLVGPATKTIYSLVDRHTFYLFVWILLTRLIYSFAYILMLIKISVWHLPLQYLLLLRMMVNDKWWMMLMLMKISAWHLCHQDLLMGHTLGFLNGHHLYPMKKPLPSLFTFFPQC